MEKTVEISLEDAYRSCLRLARSHYENFPVASMLMPRRLRPHIAAVYAFARLADDIADEGTASPEERRRGLEAWRSQLRRVEKAGVATDPAFGGGEASVAAGHAREATQEVLHPLFIALGDTIRRFDIPPQLFHDLLDAFVQDTEQQQYETFDELRGYCRRSADPVGRIILSLFGCLNEETGPPSDALCTGLQLVNFWQDVSVDRQKPRLYVPLEDLARFGLSAADILDGSDTHATRTVIAFEVDRTRAYFRDALPLFPLVPRRLRLELNAIWRGGMRVLEKIENQRYTVIQSRPALSAADTLSMLSAAVLKGMPHAGS